jgi:hypothetical protein
MRVAGVSPTTRAHSPTRTLSKLEGGRMIVPAYKRLYKLGQCLIKLLLRRLNRLSFARINPSSGYRVLLYLRIALAVRLRLACILKGCRLGYADGGKRALPKAGGGG